ncbi:MAG TPA: hypothetical protein VN841_29255 [Bryobacteraceae bacterium]|nr:hypothetical protein [Bryobacteraceae bacterium]
MRRVSILALCAVTLSAGNVTIPAEDRERLKRLQLQVKLASEQIGHAKETAQHAQETLQRAQAEGAAALKEHNALIERYCKEAGFSVGQIQKGDCKPGEDGSIPPPPVEIKPDLKKLNGDEK